MRFRLSCSAALVALLATPAIAEAQYVIEGVVHDAATLQPLSGVAVFLLDDATGDVVSPGALDDPAQQGRVTAEDGRYRFDVAAVGIVRLSIERPDAQIVFPSATRPPAEGVACREIQCPNNQINESGTPTADGIHALRFDTNIAGGGLNNHLPVDRLDKLITATLDADRRRIRRGDHVVFTASFETKQLERIEDFEIALSIPEELRLRPDSIAVVRRAGTSTVVEAPTRQSDLVLRVGPVSMGPGEQLQLRVAARAIRLSERASVPVRTWLERPGGIIVSNESAISLAIDGDPTLDKATVLGRVFCDRAEEGRRGWQDDGEPGLYGARVYLDTGFYAETDRAGLFHFSGVPPGTRLLKLDVESIPGTPTSPIRQQIYSSPGTPAKVRFAVDCSLETWASPTGIDVKTTTVAAPVRAGPRTIAVGLATSDRTLRIADRRYRFATTRMRAVERGEGVRLFLDTASPFTPTRWRIYIEEIDTNGNTVRRIGEETLTGRGPPPLFVDWFWDRRPAGVYRAQIEIRAEDMDVARSAPIDFGGKRRVPPPPPDVPDELELLGTVAVPDEVVELGEVLQTVRTRAAPYRLVLVGHWEKVDDAEERAKVLAERVQASLVAAGIDQPIEIVSAGATVPLVPSISARLAKRNRRVDIRVAAPRPKVTPVPVVPPPKLRAPGLVLTVDQQSGEVPLERWSDVEITIDLDAPAKLQATLRDPDGGTATIRRVVTTNWVTRPPEYAAVPIATTPGVDTLRVGDLTNIDLTALGLYLGPVSARATPDGFSLVPRPKTVSAPAQWALLLVDPSRDDEILASSSGEGGVPTAMSMAVTSSIAAARGTELVFAARFADGLRAERRLRLPPLTEGDLATTEPPVTRGIFVPGSNEPLTDAVDPVARTFVVTATSTFTLHVPPIVDHDRATPPGQETTVDASAVAAADVEMKVPPSGRTLSRLAYPISGRTRPTNRLFVNGVAVPVDENGNFSTTVPLEPGDNVVRLESKDELDNRATFERKVTTSSSSWFLLAMGEAEVGLGGGRLAGSNRHSHVDAGPFSLDGRAVAYGKARFALEGPVKRVEIVGRLDTAALPDATVTRLEDDPLRLLPAFGDESVEVQETASRYKIDLTVRADDNRLSVGNRVTTLDGFAEDGYFAFRRGGFGIHGEIDQRFGEHDHTRITGMVGFENDGTKRGHDELLGTGGTMFWLSNRDVVEGSERVRIVVRDRDTGQTLASETRTRGKDYEIRPHEGRLVFREPVTQAVGLAVVNINRTVGLTGHTVFVVVDYTYLDDGTDDGTFGVEARETLYDQVEIYGAAAGETTPEGRHRLYGAGIAYRPTNGSFIELEYAKSSGTTNTGRLSVDGGLTFADLNLTLRAPDLGDVSESSGPFFGALDEHAVALAGKLDFADVSSRKGYVRAYGRKAGLGFSSLGSARQSGRLEAGFAASYDVTDTVTAHAAFDAAIFVVPELIGAMPAAEVDGTFRGLARGGVTYKEGIHGVDFQVAHLHTDPVPLPGSSSSTGLAARYDRKLSKDLTLTLGLDALVATDGITRNDIGVMGTTAGLAYRLSEHLDVSLLEHLRWNGDNATQVGVRLRADDGLSSYIAERFSTAGGRPVLTTVLGAEDYVAEGSRTYGELQLGSAAHPTTTRAVLGMDNRWRIADGVDLLIAYERAHLLGGGVVTNPNGTSPFLAPFGGLASTLGGFGAPVEILPGAVSRDALATGIVYTGLPGLKLSTRIELRVDDGDEAQAGRDFRAIGGHAGLSWRVSRDVTALGRVTFQHVTDTQTDLTWAKALEGSVGAALRPRTEDWFTLILRYTRLAQQRPRSLTDDVRVAETRDAISVEPIIDTPWNVQLVERVALVSSRTETTGLADVQGTNVLWVNRVNARPFEQWEGGLEYRMLLDLDSETAERGFLVELGYLPDEHVRIGLGYNFTSFSDDVLVLTSEDAAGPFLRVTARY